MGNAAGHRSRWTLIGLAIVGWFVALPMNVGGNAVHLLLVGALVLVVYELLAVETPG
ncbi:MAG TPA: DUF5670 family protein [Candidatus Saccharimonadales bacterium]|nr:DUF5670 family protein [Candidatus Saccharimonadales bacterium]